MLSKGNLLLCWWWVLTLLQWYLCLSRLLANDLTFWIVEFGLFVNRYGQPGRVAELIQWEGTAERVALQFPYVLLFNPRFIEVRHLQTGRLVQVIPGSNVRCIRDGRRLDVDNIPVHNEVHVVMGAPSMSDPSTVLQQVFALCQSTRHLTIED